MPLEATQEGPDATVNARNSSWRDAWMPTRKADPSTTRPDVSASISPVFGLYVPAFNTGSPAWGPRYTHVFCFRSWYVNRW